MRSSRLSRYAVLLTLAAVVTLRAAAAPPSSGADYQHTAWTAVDGAPARILAMAQTTDGWLWLGTADGLFRFDGVRFERVPLPPGKALIRDSINSLFAAPNGDLYISYFAEGVSVLHPDGRVDDLPPQAELVNSVGAMAQDKDGSLWVLSGNIQHFHHGQWKVVEDGPEWRSSVGGSLFLDQRDQLWAANDAGVWRLDRSASRFVRVADGGGELLLAPDGRLWQAKARGIPRLLVTAGGTWPPAYRHAASRSTGLFDGEGALWRLNCERPVCLIATGAESVQSGHSGPTGASLDLGAFSGVDASAILEDRDGDIWIATEGGLDRFRPKRLRLSGLPGSGTRYSLGADGEGRMWAADRESGALWRLGPGAPPAREDEPPVSVIANGRDGALLVGFKRSIQRRTRSGSETIPLPPDPDGKPRDHHMLGILDDGKVLWTATMETGLIGWRNGRWWPHTAFRLPAKIYQSAPAGPGQLWLATGDGKLVFYDNDKSTSFDVRAVGTVTAIFPGSPLTVSGSGGFGVLVDGMLRLLRSADPDALRNVSGMVKTADGDRWLNGSAGLVHVRAADWRRSMDDPALPLRYELLGASYGYPGQAVVETRWRSAMSADGRTLWLAATGAVVRLDTAALRRNRFAPQATILSVTAGNAVYPAHSRVALPPGSGQFRIQFTAPALHMPERIRFEYRLDGFDKGWLDSGSRRATSYTNIAPGDYLFRVRALNEDGTASPSEGSVSLRVEPTLIQTFWFKLACAAVVALLAALLYRYRVRYLTGRLAERLQVRNAERERIARTLHDTFLQTVQGLVLRVDAIAAGLPTEDSARGQLEHVLADASHAIGEGREQLQELRSDDVHVLEDVVVETVTRLRATYGWIAVDLRVEGEQRALGSAVSGEIAEIVREALRNAFAHSSATQIRVSIDYGRRKLGLKVADNGKGIDQHVLRYGSRDGHWGLVGMRERAARICARLRIDSTRDGGTTVALTLATKRAYADAAQSVM
jgi:signal transduction histidine kinase/ligand-binding sensor domain-containing protein